MLYNVKAEQLVNAINGPLPFPLWSPIHMPSLILDNLDLPVAATATLC